MTAVQEDNLIVDGQAYNVQILKKSDEPPASPRLVVVAFQPNLLARKILEVCLQSIQRYTPEPHELWVVDNNSPVQNTHWLLDFPRINVILNRTNPLPPEKRQFWRHWKLFQHQQTYGSYANAIGLELAVRRIHPQSRLLMPLHMDILACRVGWLSFLQSKLDDRVKASGVLLIKNRVPEGVLHVLGYLVDFQLFQQLKLDFFPRLPQLDVGDQLTISLREAGYSVWACRNTFINKNLESTIQANSPFNKLSVFRAFDDNGNVIFMHLARGVRKTTGEHHHGITPREWIDFANQYILPKE